MILIARGSLTAKIHGTAGLVINTVHEQPNLAEHDGMTHQAHSTPTAGVIARLTQFTGNCRHSTLGWRKDRNPALMFCHYNTNTKPISTRNLRNSQAVCLLSLTHAWSRTQPQRYGISTRTALFHRAQAQSPGTSASRFYEPDNPGPMAITLRE